MKEPYLFCNGSHYCPVCKLTKPCDGGAFGHDSTEGQGKCHNRDGEVFCQDCQNNRWEECIQNHKDNDEL